MSDDRALLWLLIIDVVKEKNFKLPKKVRNLENKLCEIRLRFTENNTTVLGFFIPDVTLYFNSPKFQFFYAKEPVSL